MNSQDLLTIRIANNTVKGRHPLIIREAKEFCDHSEIFFTARHEKVSRLRIEDIVVACGLEEPDMFFDEKHIVLLKELMHRRDSTFTF